MTDAAVVFDLDGTLFDTVPEIYDSVRLAAEESGVEVGAGADASRSYLGDGIRRFVKRALTGEHWGEPDPDLFEAVLARTLGIYEGMLLRRDSLYPTVAETLALLQEEGWRLGVATNKLERFTVPLLRRFLPSVRFGCVVCGDSLPTTKPDPGPLLHAAAGLGVAPSRAVMVGDSVADVNASEGAGFARMVLVSYGYHQRTGLEGLEADAVIGRMDELPEALVGMAVT